MERKKKKVIIGGLGVRLVLERLIPKKLVREYFDMKKQMYYCYFRIPWQHKLEMRVSKGYSLVENNWIDAWNNLSDYDGDLNEYQGSW